MAKGLPFFLYIIITHTHIVCAVKSEADEAMAKDLRMAVEVNSEAEETVLGFDAPNRKEALFEEKQASAMTTGERGTMTMHQQSGKQALVGEDPVWDTPCVSCGWACPEYC